MRHAISVLLQNEVGALTRMTGMFSSRGYNIDSLNVAPTDDPTVSRVTLVISGFERELAIVKVKLATGGLAKAMAFAKKHGAEILDDSQVSCTIQLTGRVGEVDAFVSEAGDVGDLAAVARSGSVAVSKGEVTLSSFDAHHHLSA